MVEIQPHLRDAYLCYNEADLDWVQMLAERIESETIDGNPGSRPLAAFFDKWDIDHTHSLIDRMNAGMTESRHLIAVLSPEFLRAEWPRFEWKHIVAKDPNNAKGRLIPILLRDLTLDGKERIELCAPFRDIKYIDFRRQSDFRQSFAELIRKLRNLAPERGRKLPPIVPSAPALLPQQSFQDRAWLPDAVQELLLSNLFSVRDLPPYIWSAESTCQSKPEVWEKISDCSPFILRDRLYTFARLEAPEEKLRDVVAVTSITRVSRNEWALQKDRQSWLTALLNSCISQHVRPNGIRQDGKGRYFFLPTRVGNDRSIKMPTGRPRTVSKRISTDDGKTSFWVHHAASLRFKRLATKLFLSITPHYLFTEDGRVGIGGKSAGRLSQRWSGVQQNPDILRNVLFWSTVVLAGNRPSIRLGTGDVPIMVEALPGATKMGYGLRFDETAIKTLFNFKDSELEDASEDITDAQTSDQDVDDEELE